MKKIKQGALRRRLSLGIAGAKSGVGLLGSRASGLLLPADQKEAHNAAALEREAKRFVAELGELKGAYVKIGQMLALYGEHLLPEPVTRALHTLEAQTTAIDWAEINTNMADDFKQLEIQTEAFAAASLAQVHRAKLAEQALCVKIQYPGIADAIDDDFNQVLQMLKFTRWVESSRQLEEVTQQLKAHLLDEVDYQLELSKAQQISDHLKNDQRYLVPQYHQRFCSSTVLTMDYVDGLDVMDKAVQNLSLARRNRLAEAMLDLFFKESFTWGLLQTDPNFGNYRIVIGEQLQHDQLALLDFGAVHAIDKLFQQALRKTIFGAWRNDNAQTIEGLIGLHCLRKQDSDEVKQSFADFCTLLMEPFKEDLSQVPKQALNARGIYDWHGSKLLKRAGKMAAKSMLYKGFTVPPSEFVLLARKLTGVFTFVAALKAEFNASELLAAYE